MQFSDFDVKGIIKERNAMVVDLSAISENAKNIVRTTGKKLIAVVKADAYGHGAAQVIASLEKQVKLFAVATVAEALEVAALGKKAMLLTPPSEDEMRALEGRNVAVAVEDERGARLAAKYGLPVHIAVDTGMHRYGADWHDVGSLLRICDTPSLKTEGIFTHYCTADCEDAEFSLTQKERFERTVSVLGARRFEYVHAANSAGALRFPCCGNAVRAGLALYGINPAFCYMPLREVSRFYAKVLFTKILSDGESVGYDRAYIADGVKRIAILGAGYADGLPYALKNYGSVLINGFICPLVGKICMDCAFADVTHARVNEGDYACVFGGEGETGYAAVAKKTGSIPYEIMTRISKRVPRVYI